MKTKTRFNKLTAWLLTLVMLMTFMSSFTISVSAEENATITDVKVLINGVEQQAGELNITDGDTVTVVYQGENFDKLTNNWETSNYQLKIGSTTVWLTQQNTKYTVDTTNNTVTVNLSASAFDTNNDNNKKIGYKHKDDAVFTYPYTINYNNQAEPERVARITGVKVLINGVEHQAGEILIADSDTVTVVYIGENFEKLGLNNQDYNHHIGPHSGNFYSFTIDTTSTPHTATKTYVGSSINYNEIIAYTNKGESETVTDYVMKEAYIVTIDDSLENGTVKADVSKVAEGDTVTLTVTPAENYEVDKVTYNDGENDIEITATEGVYSFIMPASDVVVTASFEFSSAPAPVVTSIDFNRNSLAYNAVTKTFYVSDDFEFVLKITGENLTMFNEKGGLRALFKQEKSGGWAIINVTIESDTSAYANVDSFALTYILNDGLGSRKATAVMLENNDNQIGETINVNLEHAPTFRLTINNGENGQANHNKTSSFIAKDTNVTITVSPDNGYELDRLIVDGDDVTAFVTNNKYTFTMPAKPIEVSVDFKALPHTHDWKFTASGNEITAACEGTIGMCPNPTSTVTLVAPENLVYNGSEKVVTTSGTIDGVTIPDVQYDGNRVNAGMFTAKLTLGDATATLDITITPKSLSGAVVTVDSSANLGYTGNAITPDVTSVTLDGTALIEDVDYTVSYSDNINAGQATVTITGKENYKDTANTNFTITKINPEVTAPTAKTDLVYNGTEQELLIPGTAEGGTMKYFIGGAQATEEVPKRASAGEYTVTCIVAGDENHNNIVVGEYTVTIAKKTLGSAITLTAPVKNTAPQTEITGDGYTATVLWSPDVTDKFGYNTEYTATITITPDENHTTEGIAANGYSVEGAKAVTNDENSNIVTVQYEKTGSRPSYGGGTVSSYTVKFETNGGTAVASKSVTRNSQLAVPTAPTKDGFTFEGWYTDKELTTLYDFDTKVIKSFTLYAKWNEIQTEDDNKPGTSGHNCPSLRFSDLDITQWYHLDTDYVIENDIFRGTTESTFTPNGNITRAMMITVLYRAEGEPTVTGKATFLDVDENAYYAKAAAWGQQNGIIKGYSETEYAPEQDILREQIAAIMHRYAQYKGIDVSVGENTNILSYDDSGSISEYAIPSMQWAVGSGMIKGRTESTLNPDAFATRVEIAAMLHRFIEGNYN